MRIGQRSVTDQMGPFRRRGVAVVDPIKGERQLYVVAERRHRSGVISREILGLKL